MIEIQSQCMVNMRHISYISNYEHVYNRCRTTIITSSMCVYNVFSLVINVIITTCSTIESYLTYETKD